MSIIVNWVLSILLLASVFSPEPKEDDWNFNCHLNGNRVCGTGTPWHGFVNLSD